MKIKESKMQNGIACSTLNGYDSIIYGNPSDSVRVGFIDVNNFVLFPEDLFKNIKKVEDENEKSLHILW